MKINYHIVPDDIDESQCGSVIRAVVALRSHMLLECAAAGEELEERHLYFLGGWKQLLYHSYRGHLYSAGQSAISIRTST
jgi:hypothetical protein